MPADFQNRIRHEYPLYERLENPGLPKELVSLLARVPGASQLSDSIVHKFIVGSGQSHISLSKDFLAVSEAKYENWTQFRNQVAQAQDALNTIYQPSFYSRIGLRYVNVIDRNRLGLREVAWNVLLNPAFVGVMGLPEVASQVASFQSQAMIDLAPTMPAAKVAIRLGTGQGDDGRDIFVIDNDFFVEGKTEVQNVLQILDEFNRLDGNLFRWAIGNRGPLWNALRPSQPNVELAR